VVVRYFGGTLLGVPGLIHAYKSAASLALQITPVVRKSIDSTFRLTFDYTRMHEVMAVLRRTQGVVLQRETQLFCTLVISIAKHRAQEMQYLLQSIGGLEIN
jgi:putative IMPACT (imprinted ancient) family translation regulator